MDGILEANTGRINAKEGSRTWVCPSPRLARHKSALQVPTGQEISDFPRRVPETQRVSDKEETSCLDTETLIIKTKTQEAGRGMLPEGSL